jgi:hypothetical protein
MSKSESPQSNGGRARAKALDKTERSEIARKAANARWNPATKSQAKAPVKPKPMLKAPTHVNSRPDFSPGTMGCHEVLHMAAFLTHAIDTEILDHPAIVKNPKWRKHALKALNAMAALYQAIGSEHLEAI